MLTEKETERARRELSVLSAQVFCNSEWLRKYSLLIQEDKILRREESGCLNGRVRSGEAGQS